MACQTLAREDEMQAAMNTDFWGPIRVLKGILTSIKAHNCSKATYDMLQSVLSTERPAYNIRIIFITAGLYKDSSKQPSSGFSEAYLTTSAGQVMGLVDKYMQDPDQREPGDLVKFGDRNVEIVDGSGLGKGETPSK
ncbi:uncharacterized protein Z518_00173 [Rhinocladiella mackenziei CBS 650.93]|uniref:Uncharacterized protein n=1 Tax=Rhinocladiella mackenziei CBS 650.93 TaxID=1442369 RepID=A0A0D2JI95_9EURO|nr:uncharacterized protein Z518_00173 [Rhinocladiella mackenziei CBS 650.93]KIX09095.1 hypothetical protein Z518_00173 [Rhinocladiella mackenziei CBS 650.93]